MQGTGGLVVGLALYILMALPLYTIGQKTNQANAWFAFVPILNLVLMIEIAGKDLWWIILFLIPCVNWVIFLILWMAIAEAVNKPSWMGALCAIPCFNVFMPFVIAFA